jgi:hypothetical protein
MLLFDINTTSLEGFTSGLGRKTQAVLGILQHGCDAQNGRDDELYWRGRRVVVSPEMVKNPKLTI